MAAKDWRESTGENIFQMCEANGGPGFWIRRTTWSGTLARIVRVGPLTGPAPYFGSPSALMDTYSLDGERREALAPVPGAGTYKTWRRIEPPSWAEDESLRPLDDPAIDAALAALNRRRRKEPGARSPRQADQSTDRIMLVVSIEREDEAKAIGARWSPTIKVWWLPAGNAPALARARALGFLE
jgi:hypothetical protein